jgi:hypothetical protein
MKRLKSATFEKDPKSIIQSVVESNRECFGEKYHPINTISEIFDEISDIFGLKLKPFDHQIEWADQKSFELEAFRNLLLKCAPFLELAADLADDYYFNAQYHSKKRKLTDQAIVKIIQNFEDINRTGRKRIVNTYDLEDWNEFAQKHGKVIKFGDLAKSKLKSMNDFKRALEAIGVSKAELENCLRDFTNKFGHLKCSKCTLYRRGLTELVRFRKIIYVIECALQNYDSYFR